MLIRKLPRSIVGTAAETAKLTREVSVHAGVAALAALSGKVSSALQEGTIASLAAIDSALAHSAEDEPTGIVTNTLRFGGHLGKEAGRLLLPHGMRYDEEPLPFRPTLLQADEPEPDLHSMVHHPYPKDT